MNSELGSKPTAARGAEKIPHSAGSGPAALTEPTSDALLVIDRYVQDLEDAVKRLPHADIADALEVVEGALHNGRSIFVAGNGGSATTAQHMASDVAAAWTARGGQGIVLSLSDNTARWSALVNDEGAEQGFSSQLSMLGRPGDLVIMLSVSAESRNLISAAEVARERGMDVIALVGRPGRITRMARVVVEVGQGDYGLTEDLHLWFNHCMVRYLRGGQAHVYAEEIPRSGGPV